MTDSEKVRQLIAQSMAKLIIISTETESLYDQLQKLREIIYSIELPELSEYIHVSKINREPEPVRLFPGSIIPKDKPVFTPAKKPIGDPLQELLHNTQKLSPSELAKIAQVLSQPETVPTTTVTPTKETT